MGFLKDLHTVNKMGKDIGRRHDVSASLANAQAAMAQANATMATMAARATSPVTGVPGTATVITARQTGQFVNFAPLVELELLVQAPGRVPMPVAVTEIVDQLHLCRVVPGAALSVKVGDLPTDLFIDWSN